MILRAENLMKSYSGKKVVKDISLQLKQGEIVGLLGPNGAGKTTSFYMIVGLIKPNSGKIYLDEEDITKFPMYKRAQSGIGYLAQEASVFRKMTVENNILSVLQLTSLSKKEQNNKMESLLDEFGLTHIRKNRGDLLSGGERRRTEIARALASDPMFILLDEPFAGVDPLAVEDIQKIIEELKNLDIPYGFKLNAFKHIPDDYAIRETSAWGKGGNPTKILGSREDINENKFYEFVKKFKDAGATILGGCCEIRPSHISKIANLKN